MELLAVLTAGGATGRVEGRGSRSEGRSPSSPEGRVWPSRLAAVCLFAAGTLGCGGGAPRAAAPGEKAAPVRLQRVEARTAVDMARLPADVQPNRRAVLAAEVPGVIERLEVQEGQRVSAGDLLVAIDTRSLRQALAEAEAVFRQAAADFERAEQLAERRSITRQQLIDATTGRDVAAARLENARLQLSKSEVKAPWAGTVAVRRVEVGDYAVPGQPLIELVDTARLKIRAFAPASDVPFLRVGAPARVVLEGIEGEQAEGTVTRLGAELDPGARTLALEVEVANPGGRWRPGMLARIELPRRVLEAAVLVPLASVVDFESEKVLYVVEGGRARRQVVELGPVIGMEVVVNRGLAPGSVVVVEGQQQVSDGQPVREVA
ncbi:MAG TPA: efflux RND transporter periplasmic adaptor subunit [Thermoanaerobaculaceae bacterium]|nr:efflux RND transporter periplasmic adaptor subunit [Thermoanaerobaculaceae bacterium]HRS17497.1 efflux RND transporter periplasmic adaptor subunit [Thermoanaerobaculaceae bacterium]